MLRTALLLDFDNLLSGLRDGAGPDIARRFAEDPEAWLGPLLAGEERRALVRRCYMNPAGWLEDEAGRRAHFGDFRWAMQAAGFEVIDCPRLTRLKNGADMRMALDAMDALACPTVRYDEFVLLSTDSDFVPLLLRLRAADRRTRLVAHPEVGPIVRAAADEVIGLDTVAGWLGAAAAPEFGVPAEEEVLATVRDILEEQRGPLHVPNLGHALRRRTGLTMRETNHGGFGSLDALLAAAGDFVRRDGPGGGDILRRDWLTEAPPEPPPG